MRWATTAFHSREHRARPCLRSLARQLESCHEEIFGPTEARNAFRECRNESLELLRGMGGSEGDP